MKGNIVLNDIKGVNELAFNKNNEFTLEISVDSLNASIEDIVMDILSNDSYYLNEDIDKIAYLFDNDLNIMNYVESVFLNFYQTDALSVIENNPFLHDKMIVLNERISFNDLDKVQMLLQKYEKYADNIYVIMDHNDNYVNIKDCLNIMKKFSKEASKINAKDLSPTEKLLYAYDKVRNGEISYGDEYSYIYKPQDLFLSKDELLSVEYNNIFAYLISFMGFSVFQTGLDITNKTLVKNFTYVNDPKYKIDGVYFFTLTWDKKEFNEKDEYFNRYLGFLKTINQFNEIEDSRYGISLYVEKKPDMFEVVNKAILNDDFDTLISYINGLNLMSRIDTCEDFISINSLKEMIKMNVINPKRDLIKKLKNLEEKFDTPIMREDFLKMLNRVRQVEYIENPNFYPYSLNDLYKASFSSGFEFSLDFDQALEFAFGGIKAMPLVNSFTEQRRRFYDVVDELELEEEIETVKSFNK